MRLTTQGGYLSLVAVLFIVIIGFLGTAVVYMIVGSATSTNYFTLSETALYIAESGLIKATRFLLTPTLSNRISCAALSGNSNLTNSAFGKGALTVTTVSGSPFAVNSTLSSALTTSSTTIPVVSTTGFATSGRILIDGEAINYSALSGNSFIDVTRGINNTLASSHVSGAYVSQLQCSLDSIGGIPNVTSALWKRELQQKVELQDAYAVGVNASGDFVITHWNQPTELAWNNISFSNASNTTLNEIDMLSNAEGWAVGNAVSTNFIYLHLLGSTVTVLSVSGACASQNLYGVSAVSSKEAWAVGVRYQVTNCKNGNYNYAINRWNGTAWTQLTSATSPSIPANGTSANISNLNAVHVIDTNGDGLGDFGVAVGDAGTILQYNGTTWTKETSPTTQALESVYVVSANEAWAVGAAGVILKWNGTSWSSVTSPTTTELNSVVMLDTQGTGTASTGWAVGNSGVAITYNGTSWSSQNISGVNFFGVKMFSQNDVWAVGVGGAISHWDGTAWTSVTSNVTTQLNSMAIVSSKVNPISAWQEIFP